MSATTTPTTPAEIDLVGAFVNTSDLQDGSDELSTPVALGAWLVGAGLVEPGTPASGRDLRLALRLRDALRGELAGHHAGETSPEATAAFEGVCCDLPLKATCSGSGLTSASSGVRGALGELVAAATTARIKGSWRRLKICPADDCGWAFYDPSRNRSKRWCSMEVCGNRSKVRAFRDRAR
ncbi:MAG: CGNR zinc finger domain-containing protein [Acidimicrobiales bacterium]